MNTHKNRKTNRLKNFDYSNPGNYFVTICTKNRISWFGEIQDNEMILNQIGDQTKKCWTNIPKHFPHMVLDEFVIMPNHIHGILTVGNNHPVGNNNYCSLRENQNEIPWQTKWGKSISSAIRGFKIGVMKWCRQNNFGEFAWQKSFFDRIIRTEKELQKRKKLYLYQPSKLDK
jgi:putative transposase